MQLLFFLNTGKPAKIRQVTPFLLPVDEFAFLFVCHSDKFVTVVTFYFALSFKRMEMMENYLRADICNFNQP